MKKIKRNFLAMLLIATLSFCLGCGSPTPTPPLPSSVRTKSYAIQVNASSTLAFTPQVVTVYSATSSTIETGSILYNDTDLANKVSYVYLKVGNNIYYSPSINGQFFPYIAGSSPPPMKK
jgi:hypothetical protein